MTTPATVTMVVPTYLRHDLLRHCLEGIRAQTYPHFEVLVCDNAHDAEVDRIIEELQDRRFHWVPRPTNLGILRNAWEGFAAAGTELVMEVDDDDLLLPDALELLVPPMLEDPDLVVAFGDLELVDGSGSPLPPHHPLSGQLTLDHVPAGHIRPFHALAARGEVYMVSAVLRRDAVDWSERPDHAGTSYDRHLTVRLAGTGRGAHHVARPVVAYRIHDDADGAQHFTAQADGAVRVLETELATVADAGYRTVLQDELTRTRILQVRSHLAGGDPRAAAATAKVVLAHPWGVRATASYLRAYLTRLSRRVVSRLRHRRLEEVA